MVQDTGRLYWWPGSETRPSGVLIWDQGEPEDGMMGMYYVYEEKEERGRADLAHEIDRRGAPAMIFRLQPEIEPRSRLGSTP